MRAKYPKNLCFTTLFLIICSATATEAETNSILEDPSIGKCFASTPNYLTGILGEQWKLDENIKIETVIPSKKARLPINYVWAMDTTPSKNFTRTLFRVNKSTKQACMHACIILRILASSDVQFNLSPLGQLPKVAKSIDTPLPYHDANEIIYKLNPKNLTYAPHECYKVSSANSRRRINCKQAYIE